MDGCAFGGVIAEVALCVPHYAGHGRDYYYGGRVGTVFGGLEEREEGDCCELWCLLVLLLWLYFDEGDEHRQPKHWC